jgi:hypothetical protein
MKGDAHHKIVRQAVLLPVSPAHAVAQFKGEEAGILGGIEDAEQSYRDNEAPLVRA